MNALRALSLGVVLALTGAACNQLLPPPERAAAQDQPATPSQESTIARPSQQARQAAVAESASQPAAPAPRRQRSATDSSPASVVPPAAAPPASVSIPVTVIEDTCVLRGAPQRVTTMADSPAFIGPVATQLPLVTVRGGTRLQVLSRTGDWLLVQFVGREMLVDGQVAPAPRQGFMNCSMLTSTNQGGNALRAAGEGD